LRLLSMKPKSVECEVERLLAVIGGKWKVLFLRELFEGGRRHAQLRRALPGISQKVPTAQLRELELDGALRRQDFETRRPHVEYSLTPFGERLRGLILEMHNLALQICEVLKRRPPSGRQEKQGRVLAGANSGGSRSALESEAEAEREERLPFGAGSQLFVAARPGARELAGGLENP
jgi:DNA-binding HxlR family transcriptional regulator